MAYRLNINVGLKGTKFGCGIGRRVSPGAGRLAGSRRLAVRLLPGVADDVGRRGPSG